ncbi:FAR1 DNA binding domain [Macleaya cordata]|uniref:Protein FAR1-RELATED SEQUENCE n=1 Tax=Macleaya cordata TaxID=56857 RepID=A0A200PR82_MACCD|nr:FAR1 DNA binding domain [Macleaya cordata]
MEFEPLNIENEVMEFDMGLGDDTVDIEHPVDDNDDEMFEGSIGRELYISEGDTNLEPYEGMEFESEEAAKAFYNSYARRVGFSTRVSMSRRSKRDGAIIQRSFVCAKEGFRVEREKPGSDGKVKRPRAVTRVGCKAIMAVKIQNSGKWVVTNYETINTTPVLKTPSPMEKQAAELYTRKLFMKFQEELVETLTFMATKMEDDGTITTYRVAKFGEDHRFYTVKFSVIEMKATCSCQMFEFSGLLCRHVLTVFRVTNVLTLPAHYVMKRWTRNAKSGVVLEERASDLLNSYRESRTVRYNNLRHEVLKYVDEGAKNIDIYNVAMVALQVAAKKLSLATKNGGKLPMLNGNSREDNVANGLHSNAGHQWGSGQPQSAVGINLHEVIPCHRAGGSSFLYTDFRNRILEDPAARKDESRNHHIAASRGS